MNAITFAIIFIAVGMIGGPAMWYFIHSVEERGKDRIRQMYAELVKEKLDVIKTALAMGRSSDEIRELDQRLERLIGTEKMLETLKKGNPDTKAEVKLRDADLLDELNTQSQSRRSERE